MQATHITPIEIRLPELAKLFQTRDASPFRKADLSRDAADYIAEAARELPGPGQIRIDLYVPVTAMETAQAVSVPSAIQGYFAERARKEGKNMRELFRSGRQALLIGLAILSACLLLSWRISVGLLDAPLARLAQESFVIIGWVAIWRPAEIFLYDWIPMERNRKLFKRLSCSDVKLVAEPSHSQTSAT
jgi:hypothetical protein